MEKNKYETEKKVAEMKAIRQKVIEKMESDIDNGKYVNERFMYIIPYEQFYLTNSNKNDEVGFAKQDVYVAVKQMMDKYGDTKRLFEIYDKDLKEIAETDSTGRIKYDKEITEDLIKMKNAIDKQNEERQTSNLKIAGLNEKGELEAYMKYMNGKIVSLTREQKENLEKNKNQKDKEQKLEDKSLENDVDEKAKNAADEKEKKTRQIAKNLGINPEDIYQMTQIKDDTFLRSEGISNGNELCAIRTRDGKLKMVSKDSKGDFIESPDFVNGSAEGGRTTYATNDSNNMKKKNTYGSIYFRNDSNKRISMVLGQYGEMEIVRQERVTSNPSGISMSSYDEWSPGVLVQSDTTGYNDVDRGGVDSKTKVVFNKRDFGNLRMNEESATIREHGGENLTVSDISKDDIRGMSSFNKVEQELEKRGIEIPENEKEELIARFTDKGITYCDEEVQEFCNKYEVYKENKEKEDKEKQEQNQKQDDEKNIESREHDEERTLENDALRRRGMK